MSQCRWAISHGSDGFLLCSRDKDHDESIEAHCTIYEHPKYGAYDAPEPGEDDRTWVPEWFWKVMKSENVREANLRYTRKKGE